MRHIERKSLLRLIWTATVLSFALFCVTACSSGKSTSLDDFIGTWTIDSIEVNGESVGFNDSYENFAALGFSVSEDGYAYFYSDGESTCDECSVSGNQLVVTDASDGTTMTFILKNGQLTLSWDDVNGPAHDELKDLNDAVLIFTRTSSKEDTNLNNLVGSWTGYDVMLNSDTEPTALSEVGLESCLSISEDLTGHLSLGEIENAEQYDIYLERSDRTTSYLAYIDGETEPMGTIGFQQSSGGKDWLMLTIMVSEQEYMQLTYERA